jgi:hypothetical protein
MSLGTLFTLFMLLSIYTFLVGEHKASNVEDTFRDDTASAAAH